jgi:hypothetical protein
MDDIDWISLEETEESKRFKEWNDFLKQQILKQMNMEKVKIPVSHLRAGNLHLSEGLSIPRLQIFSVKIDKKSFSAITVYGISLIETGLVSFEPIELTESWLKKFGFEESQNKNPNVTIIKDYKIWKVNEFILIKEKDGYIKWFYNGEEYVHVKYVHELQNLWFALYKSELELTGLNENI